MNIKGWKRWIPITVYSIVIFIESAQSQAPVPDLGFTMQDKLYHLCGYGLFGLLVQYALTDGRRARGRVMFLSLLIGAIFGASDEFHQYFVPGRSCEFGDWVADVLGVALSIGCVCLFNRIRKKR